jgi:hypothetical protein
MGIRLLMYSMLLRHERPPVTAGEGQHMVRGEFTRPLNIADERLYQGSSDKETVYCRHCLYHESCSLELGCQRTTKLVKQFYGTRVFLFVLCMKITTAALRPKTQENLFQRVTENTNHQIVVERQKGFRRAGNQYKLDK